MEPRLLKVVVQPVFVVERDGDLSEVVVAPVTLSASEWRDLDSAAWASTVAEAVASQVGSA